MRSIMMRGRRATDPCPNAGLFRPWYRPERLIDSWVIGIVVGLAVWEYALSEHGSASLTPRSQILLTVGGATVLATLVVATVSSTPGTRSAGGERVDQLGSWRLAALCAALMLPTLIGVSRSVAHEDAWVTASASVAVAGLLVARIGLGYRQLTAEFERRLAAEQDLARATTVDGLTGMVRRAPFEVQVGDALGRLRTGHGLMAVMCLDLDHFKVVNDGFGHDVGNAVLAVVADRLRSAIREHDLAGRLDGDEFSVLLEDLTDVDEALAIGERLRQAIHRPMRVGDIELTLGASIGIAFAECGATDSNRLLADTDAAVVEAKRRGRNTVVAFDLPMGRRAVEWLTVEHDLAEAAGNGELRLHYQPQVDLATGRMTAVEGLIRWEHPRLGLLGPGAFLDVAEDSGLIVPIGSWVIEEAVRQAAAWQAELGADAPRMSINVSPTQLARDDVAGAIDRALSAHGLPADALVVEVTESAIMADTEQSVRMLEEIDRLGVEIAVDDFGTGYFSLSHLRRLPVRTLKIDQTFVAGLGRDPEDEAIVVATIGLAHALGLNVIAEGVETADQLSHLLHEGCDMVQGYLFGRPAVATALARDIRDRRDRRDRRTGSAGFDALDALGAASADTELGVPA